MTHERGSARKALAAVFVGTLVIYSLVAWDRLGHPSAHFHFVDLAESFFHGRLDTDTPKQRARPAKPDDPPGYREAVKRTLDSGGWNDWASIRELKLKDGTVVRGRFPWGDTQGEKRHIFYTTDGFERKIVVPQDLARDCGPKHRRLCDKTSYYISFPPAPAFIMMPFAAIWHYETNDVLITLVFGAANAALLFWLLELLALRGHTQRTRRENLWLTVAFALGSIVFFASVRGEVWFTALVFGVTFNLLYILAALDTRHPILAGLMLGLGMATRTPIAFTFVFFAWQLFFPGNRWKPGRWGEIFRKGALFATPILLIGGALMAYNAARFGSPLEFGHSYLTGGPAARIREHGLFSTYFLNLNLSAALTNMPRITTSAPYVLITKHGLGLLFTTPLLLLLARPKAFPPLRRAAWLAVAFAAVPGLLYQNTGWEQFGYRFAMDYFPYLMILLALSARPITRRVQLVIGFAIAVNLFGAITFERFGVFYY